jgi:hypothetical protein
VIDQRLHDGAAGGCFGACNRLIEFSGCHDGPSKFLVFASLPLGIRA